MLFKILDPSLATLGPKSLRVKQGKCSVCAHSVHNDIYGSENENKYCRLNTGSVQALCWRHVVL